MRFGWLGVLLVLTASSAGATSPAGSSWPQWRANAQHTSSATVSGPSRPKLLLSIGAGGDGSIGYPNPLGISLGADGSLAVPITRNDFKVFNADGSVRWSYSLGLQAVHQPAISDDGQVFANKNIGSVVSLNLVSGSQSWSNGPCGSGYGINRNTTLSQVGNVYAAGSCFYNVTAYTPAGGILWTKAYGSFAGPPTLSLDESVAYIPRDPSSVDAVNALTGATIWTAGGFSGAGAESVVGPDGTIYVTGNGSLTALNPDGTTKWSAGATILNTHLPAVALTTAVVATGNLAGGYFITALNTANGAVLWDFDIFRKLFAYPIVGADYSSVHVGDPSIGANTIYFSLLLLKGGAARSFLVALDAGTGQKKWLIAAPASANNQTVSQLIPTSTNLFYSDGYNLLSFDQSTASTFTVSASTPVLVPGGSVTFTANVRDAFNVPASSVPVYFEAYGSTLAPMGGGGFTDSNGNFSLTFTSSSANSSLVDSTFTVRTYVLDFTTKDISIHIEEEAVDHYAVSAPSQVLIGAPFQTKVLARNKYDHGLPSFPGTAGPVVVNLLPVLADSFVSGTGALGQQSVTIVNGTGTTNTQTYNRVENIQILAAQDAGTAVGVSTPIVMLGPDHFTVTIPTGAQAGLPFSMTIRAVDANENPVTGYAATLSLSALQAGNTTQAGGGILGVTNVNLPANSVLTITNQTYTKAESIRLRVVDTGQSVSGISSSATVSAGAPSSLTLSANPQSTIASVPSVLTATAQDLYGNAVATATVAFSILNGSGTLALSIGGLPSAVTSTSAVTNALGKAEAFFASTNTTSSQADLIRASIGSLISDTTIYNAVLITPAGGVVTNLGNAKVKATVPANAYGYNIRATASTLSELSSSEIAVATTALSKVANTFVPNLAAKFTAVKDSSPSTSAGKASQLVTIELPYTADASNNISVGALLPKNLLVPLSVLRVFRLNQATSVFEMVLDGTNLPNSSGTVAAQVTDPNGIYALGAPSFSPIASGSSGTVTTTLASGATASVQLPAGAFTGDTTLLVSVPSASSVPTLPSNGTFNATGLTISVNTSDGQQPQVSVPVVIGYKDADVARFDPAMLRMARYDAATGWVLLDSSVDTAARTVTGNTDHFSLFQIVAVAAGDLSQGVVYPNPFRPSRGHTKIKFANFPGSASVRVYSASGRLLKELDLDTAGQLLTWDGKDGQGRELPSGVYLAVVDSNGAKRTFKFAVQR